MLVLLRVCFICLMMLMIEWVSSVFIVFGSDVVVGCDDGCGCIMF